MTLRRLVGLAFAALLLPAVAVAQPVQGKVISAGFPAATATGYVARDGQWIPILAELVAVGSDPLECEIVCVSADLDGDRVDWTVRPPPINPQSARRVWCYATQQFGSDGNLDLKVIHNGQLVNLLDVPVFERLSNNALLVLDVSQPAITRLQAIETRRSAPGEFGAGQRYYRDVVLARMPARDLPDRWFGLEAVNVVVWDQPNPGAIEPAQVDALIRWVRSGGQLVVGLGPAWPLVRGTALAEVLPVSGEAATDQVDALPEFFRRYCSSTVTRFSSPISVARITEARGLRVANDRVAGRVAPIIVSDLVGSGRVTVTTASLADLCSVELRGDPFQPFLSALVDLNPVPAAVTSKEATWQMQGVVARPLYDGVVESIEFQQLGSFLLLVAFLFVAAYVGLSTLVSWIWLKRRNATHHSWTVFASMAVVCSVLSLGAVQLTRGCQEVHSVALVDLVAGSSEARAYALFGYKSAARQLDDLSLPTDATRGESYLRGLSASVTRLAVTHYTTPQRYRALPARARLDDVPMRATLKQFEGYWQGELEGAVRAQLVASRADGSLTADSWLLNDLDVNIDDAYVLYIDPRIRDEFGDVPAKIGGWQEPWRPSYRGSRLVPPAASVLAVRIGPIARQVRVSRIGREAHETYLRDVERWASADSPDPSRRPEPITLWDRQVTTWAPSLWQLLPGQQTRRAAPLLLSTRGLYLHNRDVSTDPFESLGTPLTSEGLLDRDVSHWLVRGQAVLLLIADAPGPVQLHRDGAPMRSGRGLTLYRVRAPLAYVGAPPPPPGQEPASLPESAEPGTGSNP